jgi:hypothetical protein
MTADAFQEALDQTPFEPFRVRLPDGRALPVEHPELVFITPTRRMVFIFMPGSDYFHRVDLMLVSDLEPMLTERKKKRR